MLSSGHEPFDARIFHKEALSLYKVYQDITILAPYQKVVEIKSGIRVVGLKARRYWWDRLGPLLDMYKKGLEIGADVYHCHEADSLLIGYLIKRKLGCKLVFDSHELHSVQFPMHFAAPLRGLIGMFVRWYEKWLLGSVDYVITVNEIIRGYFLLLRPFVPVEILYNYPILDMFQRAERNNERIVICHQGIMNFHRGLREILDMLIALRPRYPSIKLLFVGDVFGPGRQWIDEQIDRYQLHDHITITGWLPIEQALEETRRAHIGLICFRPLTNNMLAVPNKLFNYMSFGLPVVAVDFPEIRRIIEKCNCGILVKSRDFKDLIPAVESLIENPEKAAQLGENGRRAVLNEYNWEKMEDRLLKVYRTLERSRTE
jgi:glycosyltransferase involved in cell wall biosynthesis